MSADFSAPGDEKRPNNDDFEDAQLLTNSAGTVLESNTGATKQVAEPNHGGGSDPGGASVWFRWRPTKSTMVGLDTYYSDFDTLLSVYQGTSLSSLRLVASDDNSGGTRQSLLHFTGIKGKEYFIAVDGSKSGSGTAQGAVRLSWQQETCDQYGTPGDDVLLGGSDAELVCGLGGDDTLVAAGGGDVFFGGPGKDTLVFSGDDALNISIDRDGGSSRRRFGEKGGPYAGNGFDEVERIEGTSKGDIFKGSSAGDLFLGRGGQDVIYGYGSSDRLLGGAGSDSIYGGSGHDTIVGGPGSDLCRDKLDTRRRCET